jgi:hypothetical protein
VNSVDSALSLDFICSLFNGRKEWDDVRKIRWL